MENETATISHEVEKTVENEVVKEEKEETTSTTSNEEKSDDKPVVKEETEDVKNQNEQLLNVVPKKFIDQNGKVKVEELAKSYKNIEHLVQEKANWEKTRENLEKELKYAFEKTKDSKEILLLKAKSYEKFAEEAKDSQLFKEQIEKFKSNPTEELLDKIEENFSPKTIRKAVEEFENTKLTQKKSQFDKIINDEYTAIHSFVSDSKQQFPEHFLNPAFNIMFQSAISLLGANFDVPEFVKIVDNYANSKIFDFLQNCKQGKININEVGEMSKIVPNTKGKKYDDLPPADLLKIEDKELLKRYINKYSKK